MSVADRLRQGRWELTLFVWVPFVLTGCLVAFLVSHHQLGFDFTREYRVAAARVLHGASPYLWRDDQIVANTAFPYPALTALVLAPWTLVPAQVGGAVASTVCALCLLGALAVLGVRDRRLYGLVLLWGPVVAGWQSANLTLPLVLGLAVVWRLRDRRLVPGILLGLLISLKPLLWPLAVWLLVTRRSGAAAALLVTGLAVNALAWELIGTGELHRFLRLDGRVTETLGATSYGGYGLALRAGASQAVAVAAVVLPAAAVLAVAARLGRRRDGDALLACTIACLAASPLVWTHYVALLVVPVAVAAPRLRPVWALPLVLWLCPEAASSAWQGLVFWGVVGAVAAAVRAPDRRAAAPDGTRAPDGGRAVRPDEHRQRHGGLVLRWRAVPLTVTDLDPWSRRAAPSDTLRR